MNKIARNHKDCTLFSTKIFSISWHHWVDNLNTPEQYILCVSVGNLSNHLFQHFSLCNSQQYCAAGGDQRAEKRIDFSALLSRNTVQQNSFNLMSSNSEVLTIQHLRRVVPGPTLMVKFGLEQTTKDKTGSFTLL
jgi:hypothetical protein